MASHAPEDHKVFHKTLKSVCRAEQAPLRTAEWLVGLIGVFCILGWRVFWLTTLNRIEPTLEPALVLTDMETNILDCLVPDPAHDSPAARTLSLYFTKIARLGVYLARAKDRPTGNVVMWRGLFRLNDITLGATLQADVVGKGDCLSKGRLNKAVVIGRDHLALLRARRRSARWTKGE